MHMRSPASGVAAVGKLVDRIIVKPRSLLVKYLLCIEYIIVADENNLPFQEALSSSKTR